METVRINFRDLKDIKNVDISNLSDRFKNIIQICLQRQSFETGVFQKNNSNWIKVADIYKEVNYE